MVITNQTPADIIADLIELSSELLRLACSCDLMYGVHCTVHSQGSRISKARSIILTQCRCPNFCILHTPIG